MMRINWALSAIAAGVVVISIFATSDAAMAQSANAPAAKAEDKASDYDDPFVEAMLADHPAEVRAINRKLVAGDREGAIEALTDIYTEYGLSALGRASDAYAIDVARKAGAVVDVLSSWEPEGCRYFVSFSAHPDGNSVPEITDRIRNFRQAQLLAYEDGKSRAPVARLSSIEFLDLVNEYLGVSNIEMSLFLIPEKVPDAQMCSILKRYWNVSGVPEARRGDWARDVISVKQ
ncbi:hypothetical protein [Rhizobium sp. 768_B6_N1_8]|uniref:hypothetical protein n=1 Tax=unclassified Rhizobium TaxID=2613769 RepID=UPI003F266198